MPLENVASWHFTIRFLVLLRQAVMHADVCLGIPIYSVHHQKLCCSAFFALCMVVLSRFVLSLLQATWLARTWRGDRFCGSKNSENSVWWRRYGIRKELFVPKKKIKKKTQKKNNKKQNNYNQKIKGSEPEKVNWRWSFFNWLKKGLKMNFEVHISIGTGRVFLAAKGSVFMFFVILVGKKSPFAAAQSAVGTGINSGGEGSSQYKQFKDYCEKYFRMRKDELWINDFTSKQQDKKKTDTTSSDAKKTFSLLLTLCCIGTKKNNRALCRVFSIVPVCFFLIILVGWVSHCACLIQLFMTQARKKTKTAAMRLSQKKKTC